MTRARVTSFLRAYALVAAVAWVVLLAFALGVVGNVQAAELVEGDTSLPAPTLEHRRDSPQTTVDAVSTTVMCPSCDTTLDQSQSPAAERMRAWITVAVQQGWTMEEIRDGLVREYDGDESILATPRTTSGLGMAAWLVPAGVILAALLGGVVLMRRWRRGAPNDPDQTGSCSSSTSHSSASAASHSASSPAAPSSAEAPSPASM